MTDYHAFATSLQAETPLADPWYEGDERFEVEPRVVPAAVHAELCAAAAAIAAAHDEAAKLVLAEPELATAFLGLTPYQLCMWQCSAPDWHGIARADVFATDTGMQVCELNSDTPSGEAEAVLLSARAKATRPDALDPNAMLARRFTAMIETCAERIGHSTPLTVGILYPTEIPEDLSMVALYQEWLVARGHRVELGSPFNVTLAGDGRAAVLGVPCDVVVRHYKTDWFGERLPVRDDQEPFADRMPLHAPLVALATAAVERRTAVVNPFGSVLTQNKRTMALLWELRDRLSQAAQHAIARWLPFTTRLELVRDELWQQREQWVLKSDYGCEGAEVVLGPHVDQATWEGALAHAITRRWVAQRYFAPLQDENGLVCNHGVYLVGGAAAGLLLRLHRPGLTDDRARIAPALVARAEAGS